MKLLLGDSLEVLRTLAPNSIDSVVCDPPYGLSFMGKKWDYQVPSVELWREVLRVLKPGGHVLSFGGTRTYHRMVVNIEDAGFEIRDQIMWIYGSGFPKSHDVSKGMDKAAGAEREVVGYHNDNGRKVPKHQNTHSKFEGLVEVPITTPSTDLAKKWAGFGTALKPANEPIVLARKPLVGTVASNVAMYGTGALNIDASRIGNEVRTQLSGKATNANCFGDYGKGQVVTVEGRWPANILFDEAAAAVLDMQTAEKQPTSRFFYVAKASKRERNAGMPEGETNNHPTIKPIKLMEYLIKMVTPPGGTVLDPFMGSGTTGVAARNLGFDFVGVELSAQYLEIAKARIGSDSEEAS